MSKKKWGWRKLQEIRNKLGRTNCDWFSKPLGILPVDWGEFNKLYFSTRPVVVECPFSRWLDGDRLMALYAALRMTKDKRKVGVLSDDYESNSIISDNIYDALVTTKDWRPKVYRLSRFKVFPKNGADTADDWIMYVNWSENSYIGGNSRSEHSTSEDIVDWIGRTHGFKDVSAGIPGPQYYGHKIFPKKFVILWDSTGKEMYNELKDAYCGKFVFLDYTPEKELVDGWLKENDTILDPMFDIRISDSCIDKRKVFHYLATNHLPKLREYAKIFPETMAQHFTKEELGELGCKFGPPYDRHNYGKQETS